MKDFFLSPLTNIFIYYLQKKIINTISILQHLLLFFQMKDFFFIFNIFLKSKKEFINFDTYMCNNNKLIDYLTKFF